MRKHEKVRGWYRRVAVFLCLCVLAVSAGGGMTAYADDSDTMALLYYRYTEDGSDLVLYAAEEALYGSMHDLPDGKGLTRNFTVDGVIRKAIFAGWSYEKIEEPLLQNDKDSEGNGNTAGKGLWERIVPKTCEIPWNMTGIINFYAVYALDYNENGIPDCEEEQVRIEYYANVGDEALDLEPFYTCGHHHTPEELVNLPGISGGMVQDPKVWDAMTSAGISRSGSVLVGWTTEDRPKPVSTETEFEGRCIYKVETPALLEGWWSLNAHAYALWAYDTNQNGSPDYEEHKPAPELERGNLAVEAEVLGKVSDPDQTFRFRIHLQDPNGGEDPTASPSNAVFYRSTPSNAWEAVPDTDADPDEDLEIDLMMDIEPDPERGTERVLDSGTEQGRKAADDVPTVIRADGEGNGTDIDGPYETSSGGSITFTDGSAEVELKNGQLVMVKGLPAGFSYQVTQIDADPANPPTSQSGTSGYIEKGNTVAAIFTYGKKDPPPKPPGGETGGGTGSGGGGGTSGSGTGGGTSGGGTGSGTSGGGTSGSGTGGETSGSGSGGSTSGSGSGGGTSGGGSGGGTSGGGTGSGTSGGGTGGGTSGSGTGSGVSGGSTGSGTSDGDTEGDFPEDETPETGGPGVGPGVSDGTGLSGGPGAVQNMGENPLEPAVSGPASAGTRPEKDTGEMPKTGDNTPMDGWMKLLFLSAAGIVLLGLGIRKNRDPQ